MPTERRQAGHNLRQIKDADIILDEMKLYYEEVRSINQHSIIYARAFGIVALTLLAYALFGLRTAENDQFWNAAKTRPHPVAAAAKVYAVSGIIYCSLLFIFGNFCIRQLGESRRHKFRYFRSISILREHLHRFNNLIATGNSRAIPIQTGLELSTHHGFEGMIPRPVLTLAPFVLGGILAIANTALFVVPLVYFVGILRYASSQLYGNIESYLLMAFHALGPIIALGFWLCARTIERYCYDLRRAQFTTPSNMEPTLCSHDLSSGTKKFLVALRFGLVVLVTISVYSTLATFRDTGDKPQNRSRCASDFCAPIAIGNLRITLSGIDWESVTDTKGNHEQPTSPRFVLKSPSEVYQYHYRWVLASLLGGTILERLLTSSFRRRPGRATLFALLVAMERGLGRGDLAGRAAKKLGYVIGNERANEWRNAYETTVKIAIELVA